MDNGSGQNERIIMHLDFVLYISRLCAFNIRTFLNQFKGMTRRKGCVPRGVLIFLLIAFSYMGSFPMVWSFFEQSHSRVK